MNRSRLPRDHQRTGHVPRRFRRFPLPPLGFRRRVVLLAPLCLAAERQKKSPSTGSATKETCLGLHQESKAHQFPSIKQVGRKI